MSDVRVQLDVAAAGDTLDAAARAGAIVLVEPLYGGPAIAAALDAGWAEVELARELPDVAPIPLVSFEQAASGEPGVVRCRVRASDLFDAVAGLEAVTGPILLAGPAWARPFAAQLAGWLERSDATRVTFVVTDSVHVTDDEADARFERAPADGWWAAGLLVRIVLEELEVRDARLTDRAGIAVTVATGAEDARAQLAAGVRARRHLARGGAADDLRVAGAVDTFGIVPVLTLEAGVAIARAWSPA